MLLNTSGGIVGGDALRIEVSLETGAAAVVTAQAAEKVYRSAGAEATVDAQIERADRAWLEWLPQETILFDGARLWRRLRVDAAATACLVAADMLVFGRRARRALPARLPPRSHRDPRRGPAGLGRCAASGFGPGRAARRAVRIAGTAAFATCIYVGSDAADRVALARDLAAGPDVRSGATAMGPVLVARWLAGDPARVRHALQLFCARFRHAIAGLPEQVPTILRT